MTSIFRTSILFLLAVLVNKTAFSQSTDRSPKKSGMEHNLRGTVYFVDKFLVPKPSMEEFRKQVKYNRAFIAGLSGYVRGEALERIDGDGNLIVVTVAVWENQDKLNEAKQAVLAEFKRIGFNPVEFYSRLNIKMEREQYRELSE